MSSSRKLRGRARFCAIRSAVESLEPRALFSASTDLSFGNAGQTRLDLPGGEASYSTLSLQSDGKIIAAGEGEFAHRVDPEVVFVDRYNSDGSIDASFGNQGRTVIPRTDWGAADSTYVLPDDRILITSRPYNHSDDDNPDMLVAMLNPDGSLDSDFGTTEPGITATTIGENVIQILPTSDPDYVLLVATDYGSDDGIQIFRLNVQDGQLDSSFGEGGSVTIAQDIEQQSHLFVDSQGRFLVAGNSNDSDSSGLTLERFNSDFSLDSSFGNGGSIVFNTGIDQDSLFDIQLSATTDGKIIAAADEYGANGNGLVFFRMSEDGVLDSTFGTDGMSLQASQDGVSTTLWAVHALPDGSIAFTGDDYYQSVYYEPYTDHPAIGKLSSDGSVFTSNEIAVYNTWLGSNIITDTGALMAGGGRAVNSDHNAATLVQVDFQANLDPSFNSGSPVFNDGPSQGNDLGHNILPLSSGQYLVFGENDHIATPSAYFIARYDADGTLDQSYGNQGIFTYPLDQIGSPTATLGSDGSVYLWGRNDSAADDGTSYPYVLHVNADGTLDSSFADNGLLAPDLPGFNDVTSVAADASGNLYLVAVHYDDVGSDPQPWLVRYTATGQLDDSFNSTGIVDLSAPGLTGDDDVSASYLQVAVQDDGSVVVDGSLYATDHYNVFFTRYSSDGNLDTSFGDNGVLIPGNSFSFLYNVPTFTETSSGKYLLVDAYEISRFNSDFSADTTFGNNGQAELDFSYFSQPKAFELPDGSILVAGDGEVIHLNSDGSPDDNFNSSGSVDYSSTEGADDAFSDSGNILLLTNDDDFFDSNDPITQLILTGVSPIGSTNPDVPTYGSTELDFSVNFSALSGIDPTTLDGDEIFVTRASDNEAFATQLLSSQDNGDGSFTAVYALLAPNGTWGDADQGNYTISLSAGSVADLNGVLAAPQQIGSFSISGPSAFALGGSVNAGDSSYELDVYYSDPAGVDPSTIDGSEISGTDAAGNPLSIEVIGTENQWWWNNSLLVRYQVTKTVGAFTPDDRFGISLTLTPGKVRGFDGYALENAYIPGPNIFVAPPTVTTQIQLPASPTSPAYLNATFVSYNGLNLSSIDGDEFNIWGTDISLVSKQLNDDGTVSALYQITPSFGEWSNNEGTFDVVFQSGSVADTQNETNTFATVESFAIAGPSSTISNFNSPHRGDSSLSFTVTYTDNFSDVTDGIVASSINAGTVQLLLPTGSVVPTISNEVVDGNSLIVTYTVDAPACGFAGGSYQLFVSNSSVMDNRGFTGEGQSNSSFYYDAFGPDASMYDYPFFSQYYSSPYFTVSYSDYTGVDTSTIGDDDITIVGPHGETYGTQMIPQNWWWWPNNASYVIPGLQNITAANDGTYSIVLNSNGVSDVLGNPSDQTTLGTFTIDIQAPTANVTTSPVINGQQAEIFSVAFSDDVSIQPSDVSSLTVRDDNGNLYPVLELKTNSIDSTHFEKVYALLAPNGSFTPDDNGTYTIYADFHDDSSNGTNSAIGSFAVNLDNTAPTVSLGTVTKPVNGDHNFNFTVTYSDDSAINTQTIGHNEITVIGPNGYMQTATVSSLQSVDRTSVTVTYSVTAPSGAFTASSSGQYAILLQAKSVADTSGNTVSGGLLGFTSLDFVRPTGSLAPVSLIHNGDGSVDLTVTWKDDVAVSAASISATNLVVTGPNGFSASPTVVSSNLSDGTNLTVVYRLTAPNGLFNSAANGTYTVSIAGNSLRDTEGNTASVAPLGTFDVVLAQTAPTAVLTPIASPALGAASVDFTVTYQDALGLDSTSITTGNITVTGPKNFSATPTLLSTSGNLNSITATYRLTAPGGTFDGGDNGAYTLSLAPGTIQDIGQKSSAAQTLGSFNVNLDATPPTATLFPVAPPARFAGHLDFTVTYSDNAAVAASSIDGNEIVVKGPNNFSASAQLLTVSPSSNASSLVATYRIASPSGGFTTPSNGAYTVTLQSNSVTDTSGNNAAADSLGQFLVNLDTTVPNASLTQLTPVTSDARNVQLQVTFSDNSLLQSNAPGANAIVITGPNGFVANATLVSKSSLQSSQSDGSSSLSAVYQIDAPNGFFSNVDNGTYQIGLAGNTLADNAGNVTPATVLGQFSVNLAPPTNQPDLAGTVDSIPTVISPATSKNTVMLSISNRGSAAAAGSVAIKLYASTTADFDPSTALALTTANLPLSIPAGTSKACPISFTSPTNIPDGNYFIIAVLDSNNAMPEQYESNNILVSRMQTNIQTPHVDLSAQLLSVPQNLSRKKKNFISVGVTNNGNITATGAADIHLYRSADQVFDPQFDAHLSHMLKNVTLKPGQSKTFKLSILPYMVPASDDYLVARVSFTGNGQDNNPANNTVFSPSRVTFFG